MVKASGLCCWGSSCCSKNRSLCWAVGWSHQT